MQGLELWTRLSLLSLSHDIVLLQYYCSLLIFKRQSQWREQFELLGSSYLQIKYIQKSKKRKNAGPISEGEMITGHTPNCPTLKPMGFWWTQVSNSDAGKT